MTEATIEAFVAWRRAPANDAAYAEVESRWRQADRVRNDPELVRLTEAALRRETLWMKVQRIFRSPLVRFGLAALFILGALLVIRAHLTGQMFRTEVGAQQIVRLDDGSVLRLNTDSKVEVHLTRQARRIVLLRGEAFFEVAHDVSPFIVEAGTARVRAIGTKFDVRRTGADTRVTLVEGRVQVSRSSQRETWTLNPNQQITVNGAAAAPRPADAVAATSWTTGRLRFRETPLTAAVAEVNRYSQSKITLDADHLSNVRVNGVFETGDTRAFISAVTELFGLEAVPTPDGVILRSRAQAGAG